MEFSHLSSTTHCNSPGENHHRRGMLENINSENSGNFEHILKKLFFEFLPKLYFQILVSHKRQRKVKQHTG